MTDPPISQIRTAVAEMKEKQVRPDANGNIRFGIDEKGHWHPFDERTSWLSGKPVGGSQ